MGAITEYFKSIGRTAMTCGDGMAVTLSYMFRKPLTIQYPDRTRKPVVSMLPERSRGMLEFDPSVCTGCVQCGKQCPIDCFDIEVVKDEETKQRILTKFEIDLGKCMYCGICVENCTQGGLRHTAEFEGSVADVKRLKVNFVTRPLPTAKPKKGEEPKLKPKGSIIREYMRDQWKPAEKPAEKPVDSSTPASERTSVKSDGQKVNDSEEKAVEKKSRKTKKKKPESKEGGTQ